MNHLQPGEILASLTEIGVNKAKSPASKLVLLGIMAGAFIAFGRARLRRWAHSICWLRLKPSAWDASSAGQFLRAAW